jgi:ribonucleotide reductase alpha subunit
MMMSIVKHLPKGCVRMLQSSFSSSQQECSKLEEFRRRLMTLLSPYRGKVTYGNLRYEEKEWEEKNCKIASFAIVYETPGGSTNQITVLYSDANGFTLIDGDPPKEIQLDSIDEVLRAVEDTVRQIPHRRIERLKATVERWMADGKSLHELLQEINKLVRSEFKGGSITHQELKMAIQYCLQLSSTARE